MPSSTLTVRQQRTCVAIFQHPVPSDLDWGSVYALLDEIGDGIELSGDNLTVSRNGQALTLQRPSAHPFAEINEIMAVRYFIEQSESRVASGIRS